MVGFVIDLSSPFGFPSKRLLHMKITVDLWGDAAGQPDVEVYLGQFIQLFGAQFSFIIIIAQANQTLQTEVEMALGI